MLVNAICPVLNKAQVIKINPKQLPSNGNVTLLQNVAAEYGDEGLVLHFYVKCNSKSCEEGRVYAVYAIVRNCHTRDDITHTAKVDGYFTVN